MLVGAVPIFVIVLNLFTCASTSRRRAQWAGVAISFVGIVGLVRLGGGTVRVAAAGNLLVLVASVAVAVYTLLARHLLLNRPAST